jgi:hypothetical protein
MCRSSCPANREEKKGLRRTGSLTGKKTKTKTKSKKVEMQLAITYIHTYLGFQNAKENKLGMTECLGSPLKNH